MCFVSPAELKCLVFKSQACYGEPVADKVALLNQKPLVILTGDQADTVMGNADHSLLAFHESLIVENDPLIRDPYESRSGAFEVKNGADLVAFFADYKAQPEATAAKIGLPAGEAIQEYVRDLVEALDDVVKPSTHVSAGSTIDLSTQGELAKVLGMSDSMGQRLFSQF